MSAVTELSAPELMEHLEQTITIPLSLIAGYIEDLDDTTETYVAVLNAGAIPLAAALGMELAIGPPEKHGDDWTFPIQPRGLRHLWPEPLRHGWSKTWDWKDDESDDLW